MGYTTEFTGSFRVEPPLSGAERDFLRLFSRSRHESAEKFGGIVRPGIWCDWVPDDDGTALEWNGREKFYRSSAWLQYLIDVFLAPRASVRRELTADRPGHVVAGDFDGFTFDHVVNGEVRADGQDGAAWLIRAVDNVVETVEINGPAPTTYVVYVMERHKHHDLDREFDAAFDLDCNQYSKVKADDSQLARQVEKCVRSVHRNVTLDSAGELVDAAIGLRITVQKGTILIALGAAEALSDADTNFALVQQLAAALTSEFGWIAYDPAQRVALRPGGMFRRRAIDLISGWATEPDGRWAWSVV